MPLARGRRTGLLPGGQVRVFILGDGVGDKVHAIRRGEILVLLQLFDLIADVFFGFLRVPLLSGFFRLKDVSWGCQARTGMLGLRRSSGQLRLVPVVKTR